MNELQTYAALRASGIDLVAQCHELSLSASLATSATATPPNSTSATSASANSHSATTHTTTIGRPTTSHSKTSRKHTTCATTTEEHLREQLTHLGMPEADAHVLTELAGVYYGPTSFTRRQRHAIAAARRNRHSLATLEMIERYTWRAPSKAQAWRMREELCAQAGETAVIERLAASYLREWKKNKRPAPERGVRRYQHGELATLALTGQSSVVADMYNSLMQLRAEDPFAAAEEVFFGQGGAARAALNTTVVIPLTDATSLHNGDGDELTLRLTNGATINGADYVARALKEATGHAVLVDPMRGPVNAYRTRRFANHKQRVMALAENPVCAWPGCNRAGEECQFHHMEPWEQGGETNADNLVTLCAYHNGVNDDPNAPPRRGRIARVNGQTQWVYGQSNERKETGSRTVRSAPPEATPRQVIPESKPPDGAPGD